MPEFSKRPGLPGRIPIESDASESETVVEVFFLAHGTESHETPP